MSGPLIRRLRLAPEPTSPAIARGAVAGLVADAHLHGLRDEALLLTSELVTNAVIHAGTEIEVEIVADVDGLRVVVTDFAAPRPGPAVTGTMTTQRTASASGDHEPASAHPPLFGFFGIGDTNGDNIGTNRHERDIAPSHPDGVESAEGGRGLLLVSRFASRWGTSHEPGGRAVWFQLDRSADPGLTPTACATGRPATAPPIAGQPTRARIAGRGTLAEPGVSGAEAPPVPDIDTILATVAGKTSPANASPSGLLSGESLTELVARLAHGLGAATATVTVDRADGQGSQVLARYAGGEPATPDGRTVRVPLPLSRPWTGEFTATGARGRHAEPVAALMASQLALMIENRRLEDAHNDGRGWLIFLAEAGELLAQSMNVDLIAALIPRLVVPRLGLWCALHLANEYGELTRAALTHTDEDAIMALAEQLDARLPRLERVFAGAGTAPLGPPVEGISLPLTIRAERLGTLTVGRPAGRPHGPDELAIIDDLGRRAAVALENARIHENRSHIASTLQQPLLPPALPSIEGLDAAAQYVPAGDGLDVGGDFYDIVALPGAGEHAGPSKGWMLVVGDVSGKGVGAAAVTGLVRDVLHTLADDHREAEHTLRRLNATLVERGGGYFCTLALAFLTRVAPGVFDLSVHLAGHDKPVLVRRDGSTSLVGECGTALGLIDSVRAPRTMIRLLSGDAVVFYTDGVTERRRGSVLYGQDRLCEEISSLAGSPAAVLASRLRASVLDFSPQQPRDDIAIVALRAL